MNLINIKSFLFKKQGIRGTIAKNFFWLSASQVGSRLIKAAITIYAARALGAFEYGVFSYAIGLAGFFIFFKNVGVDAIVTREIAQKHRDEKKVFSTAFWIEIVLLIVTVFLILTVAPLFSKINAAIVLLPIITVMIVSDDLRDLFVAFFRGKDEMQFEAAVVFVTNVATTIFGFAALFYAVTPLALAAAYAAASVAGTVIAGAILLARHSFHLIRDFDVSLVKPIVRSAVPIAVGGLAGMFLFNVDVILLGWWRSPEDIGIYAAAQKIVGILPAAALIITTSIFPTLARLVLERDEARVRMLMERTMRLLFLMLAPLVIGGVILRTPIMEFVFGAAYGAGSTAFALALFSLLGIFPLAILTNFVFAHDAQKKVMLYPLLISALNILLNVLLIPPFGIAGAAFATSLVFIVYIVLMFRFSKRLSNFSVFSGTAKMLAATALMGAFTYLLSLAGVHVLVAIGVSGLFYAAALYCLRDETFLELLTFRPIHNSH